MFDSSGSKNDTYLRRWSNYKIYISQTSLTLTKLSTNLHINYPTMEYPLNLHFKSPVSTIVKKNIKLPLYFVSKLPTFEYRVVG